MDERADPDRRAPTAIALQQDDKQATAGDTWVRTELFFGTDKPGPDVTDHQFNRFVNDTVTPRFPDGLTVLAGNGQWKDSDTGRIIRDAYEKKFQQQSVLRTDSTEQVVLDERGTARTPVFSRRTGVLPFEGG